jgi:1,4-alpha-glucan branching enzyme
MSSALAEAFAAEELSLIQSPDAPTSREISGLEKILDCKSEQTFLACKIGWAERDREPHAVTLRLYQALLRLRRTEPTISCS